MFFIKLFKKSSRIILLMMAIMMILFTSYRQNAACAQDNCLKQTTDTVLMVRPVAFEYNSQTADSNAFQKKETEADIQDLARVESDDYIKLLEENGIKVVTVEDTEEPHTPDSIFPNNWFSTHEDGTLVLYPMTAENRRLERKETALAAIKENFDVKRIIDLTPYENEGLFLEGTGSMVLDRQNKIVYACRSPRTCEVVLDDFCEQMGYSKMLFDATDQNGQQIYHTNVLMHVGTTSAVICLDAIKNTDEKKAVIASLTKTGKTIVDISFEQMNNFAGNMLELINDKGEPCLVMSKTAYDSLTDEQISILQAACKLITPDIKHIENSGGGSARCMIAEIY